MSASRGESRIYGDFRPSVGRSCYPVAARSASFADITRRRLPRAARAVGARGNQREPRARCLLPGCVWLAVGNSGLSWSAPHPRAQERRDGNGCDNQCEDQQDRKSTRLNSSHGSISYAVFCLKKKKKTKKKTEKKLKNVQ